LRKLPHGYHQIIHVFKRDQQKDEDLKVMEEKDIQDD